MIHDPLARADVFYDRDLLVCFPDEMWSMSLTCPRCGQNDSVKVHGWSEQPARRVRDMFKDFDLMVAVVHVDQPRGARRARPRSG
jgi:hypothetical protein